MSIPYEIARLMEFDKAYQDGYPMISDLTYDVYRQLAKEKYPDHSYFQEVGAPVAKEKVELPFVLGSLKKIKPDTIKDFLDSNKTYVVSDKVDGVSFMVVYEKGMPVFGATRGNGTIGKNITDKVRRFCPPIKETTKKYVMRGEAVLLGDEGKRLGFKNNRNGAAGILNRDDNYGVPSIVPIFYEILETDNPEVKINRPLLHFEYITSTLGLRTPRYMMAGGSDIESINIFLDKFDEPYEIDGAVIVPIEYERENELRPENKVAYKRGSEAHVVDVLGVDWDVTRTGRVTPVVRIRPTEIGGVTVRRATGHNAQYIMDMNIGKGAKISVVRSGDVIPYIEDVIEISDDIRIPKECPKCKVELVMAGVDLVCKNRECLEKCYKEISYFLRTMGAEEISTLTVKKMKVTDIRMIYQMNEFDIANIPSFGYTSAKIILEQIKKTLKTNPYTFIAALGIAGIGKITAKKIYDHFRARFDSDAEFMEVMFTISKDVLMRVNGVGDATANRFCEEIKNFRGLYEFMRGVGMVFTGDLGDQKPKLQGAVFTLTGKGPYSRAEVSRMIQQNGGEVRGISKNTTFLVAADINTRSGKAKKAREYGITIISYNDLIDMIRR